MVDLAAHFYPPILGFAFFSGCKAAKYLKVTNSALNLEPVLGINVDVAVLVSRTSRKIPFFFFF